MSTRQKKDSINRRNFIKTTFAGACVPAVLTSQSKDINQNPDFQKKDTGKIKEFRTLGRTGFKVSDIGFGAGLLSNPDVLNASIERGINYIDTAEHYGGGRSEKTIGEVIGKHNRKKIFITTKLNLDFGEKPNTTEKIKERFKKCLERMKTDYADCLMLHSASSVEQVKHPEFHKAFAELKSDGKVRFLGISNHGIEQSIYGSTKVKMEDIIMSAAEDGRFDMALFVYNFLQKEQGEKIIRKCREKNVGTTLMKTNPVNVFSRWQSGLNRRREKGEEIPARLLKRETDYIKYLEDAEKFKKKYKVRTNEEIRDAATGFVLSNPGVHTACPSINNFQELEAFIALSGKKLEDSDTSMLFDYKKNFGKYYCRHACGTCEDACPENVPVNTIMRYNFYFEAQNREKHAMSKYAGLRTNKADKCLSCPGNCESKCPYNVPVQTLLVHAHENLVIS